MSYSSSCKVRASATLSEPFLSVLEVRQTSAPKFSQKFFILVSSVAIILLSIHLISCESLQVLSIKDFFSPSGPRMATKGFPGNLDAVSYTHLRAHET